MVKNIVLALIFFVAGSMACAQSKIAKIKFEEAEESYEAGDFKAVLTKLDEAEQLFGKTNPPMLYLRIITQDTLISANKYQDYRIISNLRSNCNAFLNDYGEVPGIDDKYRMVYRISKKVARYPKTINEFNDEKRKIENEKKLFEEQKKINEQANFRDLYFFPEYVLGLSVEQMQLKYPLCKKFRKEKDYEQIEEKKGHYSLTGKYENVQSPTTFYVRKNKIVGSLGFVVWNGMVEEAKIEMQSFVELISSRVGFEPEKVLESSSGNVVDGIQYTWKKDRKIIQINYAKNSDSGAYLRVLTIDYALAD